jgi:hypothetical protein
MSRDISKTYWSFKETYEYPRLSGDVSEIELWFADYWSSDEWIFGYGRSVRWIGPLLVLLFETQIFAVSFAALSIFKVKPSLFLLSTALNVFMILCMWLVNYAMEPPYPLNRYYAAAFQAGFWFTFPSTILFFTAFLLSWRLWKVKTSDTPISFLQQSDKAPV